MTADCVLIVCTRAIEGEPSVRPSVSNNVSDKYSAKHSAKVSNHQVLLNVLSGDRFGVFYLQILSPPTQSRYMTSTSCVRCNPNSAT
jgi:hypothetical protein